ncbi:MAG: hypothetical protein K9N47_21110 [Prosthecobacter sp.]|uniref:hypothetical protein n=1 Tax=Prosthecobacter sp. TaxID=1965333 RepID=UPI00260BE0C3|nr:hypothetical protein [Prosthecobacter sp.]MCF7788636.1 hypothetical protein [Prosthecobacter sp.]
MNTRYPPVPQIVGERPQFKYSAPWADCRIIHEHDCMGTRLLIVGDPDCGGYEWVILTSGKVQSHSNDGYGISEVALRDGLIEAFKDCFTAKPNPAHKEALEKMHELLTAALQHVKQQEAELLKPLRDHYTEMAKKILKEEEERIAQAQPEEEEVPHATTDSTADKSDDLWGGPRSQPRRGKHADTSHAATPEEAINPPTPALPGDPESSASAAPPACQCDQAPHDAASSLSAPTSTHAAHGLPADNPSACGEAMNSSAKPSASAAAGKQTAEDSCGDINGDGLCHLR